MSGLKYLATSTFLAVSGFLSSCGTPSQWAGLQPLQQPLAVVETIAPIPSSNLEDSCECKEAPGKYDGKYDNHNVFVDYSKNKLEEVVAKSVVKIFSYQKYELYLNGKLVDSDEVRLSIEHVDFIWLELDSFIKLIDWNGDKKKLKQALSILRKKIIS